MDSKSSLLPDHDFRYHAWVSLWQGHQHQLVLVYVLVAVAVPELVPVQAAVVVVAVG